MDALLEAGDELVPVLVIGRRYLHQYATHAAWLEDHRQRSNGALTYRLIRNPLAAPASREFKGYWQRKAAQPNHIAGKLAKTDPFKGADAVALQISDSTHLGEAPDYSRARKGEGRTCV